MSVLPGYALPKGSSGMTLFGTHNDDTTVTLPSMGFSIKYGGTSVSALYSSGNSWIGFGSGTQHLNINNRDASYNNLYYASEVVSGKDTFRIRFEGNSYYSSWGANDLIWELTIFADGTFMLVVEKSPNNGTDSFAGGGTSVSVSFKTGKSYVFLSSNPNGTAYTVVEGSYVSCMSKYLFYDSDGVKSYANSTWSVVAAPPVTSQMLLDFGIDSLPNSLTGLQNNAVLYFYTDDPTVVSNKQNYSFTAGLVVTSKPKTVVQNADFQIPAGKAITSIEIRNTVTGGRLRVALSLDSGTTYYTFNKTSLAFEPISINDIAAFLANGIIPADISAINYTMLNTITNGKIRLAYILEKPLLTDICKLKAVKINLG